MRLLLIVPFIILASCAHEEKKKTPADEPSNPATVAGTRYTTLEFSKGKSELTTASKENLKNFLAKSHQTKKAIGDIRILAWADTEYPNDKKDVPKSQVILASERAQEIRDYLEVELREVNDIDAYNMAKRPDLLSKMFRSDEYDVKKAFETTGTTATRLPDGSVSYTKASKAIVIIDYEGTEDNLK
ncbi:hypothetical protein [Peredibacter starrii]|uniref:OmpA-like domain-containing protein n=1 Tax=Peredibacter starrii TaxID=28202 RepID=A0AAX4HNA3_9BACT|nr:hypothetical protein [Peredibacter starrii]WPU64389.1 hypothetical protein SOO65_16980 [Peredibacter starrii]